MFSKILKHTIACSYFIVLMLLIWASPSLAKNLNHRLGVGVKNNTVFDLPAVAAVYYPNDVMGVTGGFGTDTAKDNSKFTLNAGLRRILYREDNMNFYFGGQFGLVNFESAGDKQSGFELNAVAGGEFFLAGLDSLGFSFEGGAGVTSMREVRFRTIGDHPLKAGIIFYF